MAAGKAVAGAPARALLALLALAAPGDWRSGAPLAGAAPLTCEGGLPGGPPEQFFEELDSWQKRYSRDSLKVSRDFLYGVYELQVLPRLEENLQKCPAPVLEIMMNSVLATDTDHSSDEARELYNTALTAAKRASGDPAVRGLLDEWREDTAHVYPFLLGMRPGHCYNASLRVYVYDVPDNLTRPVMACASGQWGTEVFFHRYLLTSSCRTTNPDEADFFYVPIYGTCLFVRNEVVNDTQARGLLWDPLLEFLTAQPHFRRRGRQDHIFLFADGQSARIWDSYDLVRSDAIFMMVESKCPSWDEPMRSYTDLKSCASMWKDIIIPGHTDHARARYMLSHNRPSEERDILMTFHGRHPGAHDAYTGCTVRGKVMDLSEHEGVDVGGFVSDYLERKGRSHFCLVPGGTSPWTNHLYESFFCGCIPVILSDEYEVAFQEFVDWPSLSIKWPEEAVGDRLYEFLRSIPPAVRRRMKAEVDRHACWFDYMSEDPECSPYLAMLRTLEKRKRQFPVRHGRFWNAEAAFSDQVELATRPRVTRFHSKADETFQLPW